MPWYIKPDLHASCLLSIAQFLKDQRRGRVSHEVWDAKIINTHLIIVTGTQIYHDMLISAFEDL